MRDKHQQFNKSNTPGRSFSSFLTDDYWNLKSQLKPLNPWNWNDLTEQIAAYPKFGDQELTVLVWNVYAMAYISNGIPSDPDDVNDVIALTNNCFLLDLTADHTGNSYPKTVPGNRGNYMLSRVHPSYYLPNVSLYNVSMTEIDYGFCFFKLPKYSGFSIDSDDDSDDDSESP